MLSFLYKNVILNKKSTSVVWLQVFYNCNFCNWYAIEDSPRVYRFLVRSMPISKYQLVSLSFHVIKWVLLEHSTVPKKSAKKCHFMRILPLK